LKKYSAIKVLKSLQRMIGDHLIKSDPLKLSIFNIELFVNQHNEKVISMTHPNLTEILSQSIESLLEMVKILFEEEKLTDDNESLFL
jgi:hypothetical protein